MWSNSGRPNISRQVSPAWCCGGCWLSEKSLPNSSPGQHGHNFGWPNSAVLGQRVNANPSLNIPQSHCWVERGTVGVEKKEDTDRTWEQHQGFRQDPFSKIDHLFWVTLSMRPGFIMHYNTLWTNITHYKALWTHNAFYVVMFMVNTYLTYSYNYTAL